MYYTQQPIKPRQNRWFVLVRFCWLNGWQVTFFDEDQITQHPMRLFFAYADKLIELYEKWGSGRTLSGRSALEAAIEQGRKGEFWINVGAEEYRKIVSTRRLRQ